MICDTCGREISEGARFCTYCGAAVQLKPPEEPTLPAEPVLPAEPDVTPVAELEVVPVVEPEAAPTTEPEVAPSPLENAPLQPEPTSAAAEAPSAQSEASVAAPLPQEAQSAPLNYAPPASQDAVQQEVPQSPQPFGAPQPAPLLGAPDAAQPFGAPDAQAGQPFSAPDAAQPTQPFSAPDAPQPTQPFSAPDAAQPYGAPVVPTPQMGQPYGAPQPAPYGVPQQATYDATYAQQAGQPTEPPKKSKAWIVILVIVGVLVLCCVGVSIGGYVLYQRALEAATVTSITTNTTTPLPTPAPSPNTSTPPGTTTPLDPPSDIPAISNGILVDNDDLTVTLELGSGTFDQVDGWYTIDCTVDNKTDKKLAMYFDYDTQVVGYEADYFGLDDNYFGVIIWPEGYDIDFLPKAKTDGLMVFMGAAEGEVPTALWGTLVVYDTDTYDTIGEYQIYLSKL